MCTYGDKCCYIHPSIPCKYGYFCTRLGCAYSHPPGFNPGMGMYPNMMQPIPFKKHKSKNPPGQEKQANAPGKNEKTEENKDEKKEEVVDSQNQMQEEKQE